MENNNIYEEFNKILSKFRIVKRPDKVFHYMPESELERIAGQLEMSVKELKDKTEFIGWGK